ncbi:MFS transporter [Nonomuraea fuscirosea]|jgi:MFS family permease|uniref:MFS transporter n=1 Tax=Nonomuraea fuscirosea TaxID=1291556 RepID=UPI002DDBD25B|nr:MFS transporter [Nonomuraea fuscirosea]WSA48340.1 MFS transporter [Nonomuraea fuscirosea]
MWILAACTAAVMFIVHAVKNRPKTTRERRLNIQGDPMPTSDQTTATVDMGGERTGGRSSIIVTALLLASLGVAAAQTIVVAALPIFGRQLGISASSAAWLLTAFMLSSAIATPIAGRIGDLFGHRTVMIAGLTTLLIGSVVAGVSDLAGSFPGLLVARVLQGLSGSVFPAAFGLARMSMPPSRLKGVIAALSAMFGVGGAVGMVLAGPITEALGTPWLFWATAIIAAAALLGTASLPGQEPHHGARLDLLGAALLSGTLVNLLLAISQGSTWGWTSAPVGILLAAAVLLGALFVAAERRSAAPLIDLRLVHAPQLLPTHLATLVIAIGMFAAITLIPQFTQAPTATGYGFGDSPNQTGLLMVPVALFMIIAAPLGTRLAARTSSRTVFQIGALLAGISLAGLGFVHGERWAFYTAGAMLGLAYGLAFASLGALVVGAVKHHQTGAATGLNTILRTIGGAIGAQLAAAIITGSAPADGPPTESGFTAAFLTAACVAAAAAVAAAAISHKPTRS